MGLRVESAFHSDAGRREFNEDAVRVDARAGLFVLADGTGGRPEVELGSKLACSIIGPALLERSPGEAPPQAIQRALLRAHERILEARHLPAVPGIATTVVVLLVQGSKLHVAHVGDSRVYLMRRGELKPLTRDHSLANLLADNPHLKPAVQRPGNTLVQALGLDPDPPRPDYRELELEAGDALLACSDGLSNFLSHWVISAVLGRAATLDAKSIATTLVEGALAQGSNDNVTAVVLRIVQADEARPPLLGWLTFVDGPRRGELISLGPATVVGRDPSNCEVVIDDAQVAPRHAEIRAAPEGFFIADLGSASGTYVNESPVRRETLVDADVLRFGTSSMIFKSYPSGR